VSGNPVVDGIVAGWNISDGLDYVTTITSSNPSVAYVRFQIPRDYVAHTTGDFNRVVNLIRTSGNEPPRMLVYDKLAGAALSHDHTPHLNVIYGPKPQCVKGRLHAFDPSTYTEYDTGIALDDFFVGKKNIFNPDTAQDGQLLGYLSGLPGAYATAIASGFVPIAPGKSYAVSLPSTEIGGGAPGQVVFFYDANQVYLGLDRIIGSYPVAIGQTTTTGLAVNGRGYVRVVLAAETSIRYMRFQLTANYTTHTADDFNRIRRAIQVENNTAYTSFYDPDKFSSPTLKPSSLPLVYRNNKVKLIKSGDIVCIRTPWSATHDFVQKLDLSLKATAWANNPFEMASVGLMTVETVDASVPAGAYSMALMSTGDDICPANFNGTYIGANHGGNYLVTLTVASHDKTVVDVGSEWTDGLGHKWYLMRVVSSTSLWFLSEDTSATDVWSFYTSVNGSTLTHGSGATHTTTITFSGQSLGQLYPAIKNQVKTVIENGTSTVVEDGVYICDFVDVKHTYDISHVPAILAYVRSCLGGATQPAFDHPSIENCARMAITYRFNRNGSVTVLHNFKTLKDVSLGYVGFIQCAALVQPSGGSTHEYIPKIAPITIGGNTYDFKAIQNITSIADGVDLPKVSWDDAANPPERFIQLVKDSSASKTFGVCVGYNQLVGIGAPATRAANCGSAGFIYTTKKQYPRGISSGSTTWPTNLVTENTVFDMVAFRCPIDYATYPSATNVSWYFVGSDCFLMLDFHAAFDGYVAMPDYLVGRKIETVEADGLTLKSGFISADGIAVSVSSYGTLVARLPG